MPEVTFIGFDLAKRVCHLRRVRHDGSVASRKA